jgi:hypothetical protein
MDFISILGECVKKYQHPLSATPTMAKTLRDYSIPAIANVTVRPAFNTRNRNYELRTSLITMV